jgi:uncharacterized membrane protein
MNHLVAAVITLLTMLTLDVLYITSNRVMYADQVYRIQKTAMKVDLVSAVLTYVCVSIAFFYIVVPLISAHPKPSYTRTAMNGCLVGFCIYAIYNLTNASTFAAYSMKTVLVDTLWGTLLFGSSAMLYHALMYRS